MNGRLYQYFGTYTDICHHQIKLKKEIPVEDYNSYINPLHNSKLHQPLA